MTSLSRRKQLARGIERIKTEPGLARNTISVLALIVIAALVGGIILGHQRFVPPWSNRLVFYASFAAVPGVSPGNGQEVRIAGVNVGDIVDAEVDDHGKAWLKLSVERGHKIYENARLVLRPKSPLNEMYVTIDPGGPPAREISDGYRFPVTSTERPIQVDEVLNHLDDNARRALTALLAETDVALTNAQKRLPAGLDAVRAVSNDLRPVAEQLEQRKELLRRLIGALGQVSSAVGADEQRLATLASGLQTTLRSFGSHQREFDQALAQLPGLVSKLKQSTQAVQALSDELDPTLHNLQRASDELPEALRDLRGTADRLDEVLDVAEPFLDAARPVVADLRPFAAELEQALPELHAATDRLDPVTNALLPYLPDLAAFAVHTRSVTSLEDANSGILRGTAPVSSHFVPPVLGPNNQVKPVPAPAVDEGTTGLQQAVPQGPEGQPAAPQDGSEPEQGPYETPGEDDNQRRILPPPDEPAAGGLLPLPSPRN